MTAKGAGAEARPSRRPEPRREYRLIFQRRTRAASAVGFTTVCALHTCVGRRATNFPRRLEHVTNCGTIGELNSSAPSNAWLIFLFFELFFFMWTTACPSLDHLPNDVGHIWTPLWPLLQELAPGRCQSGFLSRAPTPTCRTTAALVAKELFLRENILPHIHPFLVLRCE